MDKLSNKSQHLHEGSKVELENSHSTISKLRKELELQQTYFENQLKTAGVSEGGGVSDAMKNEI